MAAHGHMVSQLEEQLRLPSTVTLPAAELSWALVGDAWETYQAALAERLQPLSFHPTGAVLPQAQCLASLAAALFAQGQVVTPEAALPVYLRGKEAWSLK
jgi:tRNA A37 threonylcarbamoyladenosine modification protein TsaB